MTQRDLADAVGMPQPSIARIERGTVLPRAATLIAMLEETGHRLAVEPRGPEIDVEPIRRRLALDPPVRARRSLGRAAADPTTSPTRMLRRLRRFGVPFVLVGDLAEVLHGSPAKLHTVVEVCHARTGVAMERLAAALEDLGAARSLEGDRAKTPAGTLQLLTETAAGDDYQALLRTAVPMHADSGLRVQVAALEDLVRIRLARGTPTDRVQVAILRAIIDESASVAALGG